MTNQKENRRRGTKVAILILAFILAIGCAIGGTIAWLTDKTEPVKNTFTTGKVDIDLTETTGETYKMVPGETITKDPVVTVKAKSEDCWLFVKIDKENNFDTYMEYTMADGWNQLKNGEDDVVGVFYREVDTSNADQSFPVIFNDTVTVLSEVDMSDMSVAETNAPALSFTAYAIQKNTAFTTAYAAWTEVSK